MEVRRVELRAAPGRRNREPLVDRAGRGRVDRHLGGSPQRLPPACDRAALGREDEPRTWGRSGPHREIRRAGVEDDPRRRSRDTDIEIHFRAVRSIQRGEIRPVVGDPPRGSLPGDESPRVDEACVDPGSRWPEIGYEGRDDVCLRVLCGGGRCRQHRDRRKGEHKQTRLPPTRERGNATHASNPFRPARDPCKGITVCPKSRFRRPAGPQGQEPWAWGNVEQYRTRSQDVKEGPAIWRSIQPRIASRTSRNVSRFAPRASKECTAYRLTRISGDGKLNRRAQTLADAAASATRRTNGLRMSFDRPCAITRPAFADSTTWTMPRTSPVPEAFGNRTSVTSLTAHLPETPSRRP